MSDEKVFPRILISAPKSGSGKTITTCAILKLLERKGFKPASFKCGPDYIDPMFHKTVLGIPSRNLDLFLMGEEGVSSVISRGAAGRDFGVIEGVMGFYDGISAASMSGSSFDIARISGTPTILIVDCKGMSRSIIPMIKGFVDYQKERFLGDSEASLEGMSSPGDLGKDKGVIQGVFLNNISDRIAEELSGLILSETGIPVIGHLPRLSDIEIQSRHLGLVMPSEIPEIFSVIDRVTDELEERFDFGKFVEIAGKASAFECSVGFAACNKPVEPVRVGVASDEAFCFYYEDNFDLLREMGAEIVPFSPLHDDRIPDVSRLILGGGYPELHAKELSENRTMIESIKRAADAGMPILAECGGFLYLKDSIKDADGNNYEMAGVLKGEAFMTKRLSHFGYVEVIAKKDNPYLEVGSTIKAHEYHYCDTTDNGDVCMMKKPTGNRSWEGYQTYKNVFAGFAHLYYPSCHEFLANFLNI